MNSCLQTDDTKCKLNKLVLKDSEVHSHQVLSQAYFCAHFHSSACIECVDFLSLCIHLLPRGCLLKQRLLTCILSLVRMQTYKLA